MTDRNRTNDTQGDPQNEESTKGKDVMRGRSFAGANIANTERGQTQERQHVVDHAGEPLDEFGEVTDAEIEAREREKNED